MRFLKNERIRLDILRECEREIRFVFSVSWKYYEIYYLRRNILESISSHPDFQGEEMEALCSLYKEKIEIKTKLVHPDSKIIKWKDCPVIRGMATLAQQ